MSLQGIVVTVGVGITVIATVAFAILKQQQKYKANSICSGPFRVIGHESCGVCLEEENWDKTILNCGHWIHGKCLQELKRNSTRYNKTKCPFCRTPIY